MSEPTGVVRGHKDFLDDNNCIREICNRPVFGRDRC